MAMMMMMMKMKTIESRPRSVKSIEIEIEIVLDTTLTYLSERMGHTYVRGIGRRDRKIKIDCYPIRYLRATAGI